MVVRQAWVDLPCREINLILHNRNILIEETLLKVMTYWLDGHHLGFDDADGVWFAARLPTIIPAAHTRIIDTTKNNNPYIQDDKADRRPGAEPKHCWLTVVVVAWVRGIDVIHSFHLRDTYV